MRATIVGGLLVVLALAGCSRPAEVPECVGTAGDDAERLVDRVPYPLSGGGTAVASEIDMTDDPPTGRVSPQSSDPDEQGAREVTIGATFELEGTTYEVVRICVGSMDVVVDEDR